MEQCLSHKHTLSQVKSNRKPLPRDQSADTCISNIRGLGCVIIIKIITLIHTVCGPQVSLPHVGNQFLPLLLVQSPFLALRSSRVKKKSGKSVRGEKHAHGWDCPSLPLCMRESERGNGTHSTAVGSLQYFLILAAVLRQTAVALDPYFSPSDSKQRTNILVSYALGHSGRGQALEQHPAPDTWVKRTSVFFSLAFSLTLICHHPFSDYTLPWTLRWICSFILSHCFTAL